MLKNSNIRTFVSLKTTISNGCSRLTKKPRQLRLKSVKVILRQQFNFILKVVFQLRQQTAFLLTMSVFLMIN